MLEILCGKKIENAFKALKIEATKKYQSNNHKELFGDFQVWKLTEDEFKRLCNVNDNDWLDSWGWWRSADGSNLGKANQQYSINGIVINAWDGDTRKSYKEDYCACCSDKDNPDVECSVEECFGDRSYENLFDYFSEEIGASTESNICALSVDLAKQNNMTMSELFSKLL